MSESIIFTGKDNKLISELFSCFGTTAQLYTSSMRQIDMENHIELIKPLAVVCCLNHETEEAVATMTNLRDMLGTRHILLILIGAKEECLKFKKLFSFNPDLILNTPMSTEHIFKELNEVLNMKKEIKEFASEAEKDFPTDVMEKKHVLVVDDDPIILKLIKEHLSGKYNVALANHGVTALKFLANKTTDLIILDYEMPNMNGPEVLASVRKNPRTDTIPVVFLTGTKDREKVQNALMLKPQGYLLKPVDKEKLLAMVESIIG